MQAGLPGKTPRTQQLTLAGTWRDVPVLLPTVTPGMPVGLCTSDLSALPDICQLAMLSSAPDQQPRWAQWISHLVCMFTTFTTIVVLQLLVLCTCSDNNCLRSSLSVCLVHGLTVCLLTDYDRTRRSARSASEDVRDGYQDAKNNARGAYYDAKDGVKDSYVDAKDSVKDTWNDAKHSVQDTYNDAKDSVRDTKQSIKDKYNETNRDINRNIEHAKQSWRDSLTPHSYVSVFRLATGAPPTYCILHPFLRSLSHSMRTSTPMPVPSWASGCCS